MMIDQLNLNHVRIFECVYRTKSMTSAARELHLTQSGVSQHIRAFEDVLTVKLFDRINQRVVPTASAKLLYDRCKGSLASLEDAFQELQAEKNQLAGRVYIGMPTEFGNNVVIPLLGKFSKKHPLVKFHFRLGYGADMNSLLLNGDVDFAFIDEFATDKKIKTKALYDETLELCVLNDLLKTYGGTSHANDRELYERVEYVDFSRDEQILRRWFQHHFDTDDWRLNVKCTIEDTAGVARLVHTGVGAGIIPGHLVVKLVKEGVKLHTFKGSGQPMKNTVSIAYLRERTQTRAGHAALEYLETELSNLKK